MSLERVPEGERRGEDAQRQVGEGQRRDERVARVDPQLPAIEIQCLSKFSITYTNLCPRYRFERLRDYA